MKSFFKRRITLDIGTCGITCAISYTSYQKYKRSTNERYKKIWLENEKLLFFARKYILSYTQIKNDVEIRDFKHKYHIEQLYNLLQEKEPITICALFVSHFYNKEKLPEKNILESFNNFFDKGVIPKESFLEDDNEIYEFIRNTQNRNNFICQKNHFINNYYNNHLITYISNYNIDYKTYDDNGIKRKNN